MNTVTVSFNTTVRQMTEMSQWPKCLSNKWPKCLSDQNVSAINDRNVSAKNTGLHQTLGMHRDDLDTLTYFRCAYRKTYTHYRIPISFQIKPVLHSGLYTTRKCP